VSCSAMMSGGSWCGNCLAAAGKEDERWVDRGFMGSEYEREGIMQAKEFGGPWWQSSQCEWNALAHFCNHQTRI
jgi:hypothetical protein